MAPHNYAPNAHDLEHMTQEVQHLLANSYRLIEEMKNLLTKAKELSRRQNQLVDAARKPSR